MLVHCWSHLRRRFVKQMRNTKSPIAEAAVRQIAALYAVEATVRGMPPEDRLAARRKLSVPIIEALPCLFRSLRINRSAALVFRQRWTRKSKTSPSGNVRGKPA